MYKSYYKPLLKNIFQQLNTTAWSFKNIQKIKQKKKWIKQCPKAMHFIKKGSRVFNVFTNNNKKKAKYWQLLLLKIPKLLLTTQKQYLTFHNATSNWDHFIYTLEVKCQNLFFIAKNGRTVFFSTKKTLTLPWKSLKKTKQQHKLIRISESHKLIKLKNFYRNFGFRRNKHRLQRSLTRTKKFKKFKLYDYILNLSKHRKKLRNNNHYPLQSCQISGASYYKIRQQLLCYYQKNYITKNINKKKLIMLTKKINKSKKERLIQFISNIELTLNSLLLRMRLLKTIGLTQQFIKHGNVYVNYNKVLSPSYNIKLGDTISIYINPKKQKCHRFHDPLYAKRFLHGLYRKNTGRQSLMAHEKPSFFTKTQLSNLSQIQSVRNISDQTIIPDILPFQAKDRIKMNIEPNITNSTTTNWKLGFLSNKIPGVFIQQNKYTFV